MKIGILCAGDEELAPFLPLISNCKITEKAMLPTALAGKNMPFSYLVDNSDYIWIMPSGSDAIWKGRINRLGFKNE